MTYLVRDIERAVCQKFDITPCDMRGKSRRTRVARPRQVAYFLAREILGASYPKIGKHFGGRDHSTIIHGVRRIRELCLTSNELPNAVQDVREILLTLTPHRQMVGASLAQGLHNPALQAAE